MSKLLAMMMKPKNYMYATIKGSLTESPSGVFSGFSTSAYLKSSIPNGTDTNVEICLKFNATNIDSNSYILSWRSNNTNKGIQLKSTGAIGVYFSTLGTGGTQLELASNYIFQTNNNYWIKIIKRKNSDLSATLYLYYSLDGINYILDNQISNDNAGNNTLGYGFLFGVNTSNPPTTIFDGSIDLNQSYIKINNTKYQLQAVVGYTVVGNPTIVDGVVSGFSAYPNPNSYIRIGVISSFSSLKIKIKFERTLSNGEALIGQGGNGYGFISLEPKINKTSVRLRVRKADKTYILNSEVPLGFTMQDNTVYYGYIFYKNNKYTWKITDEINNELFSYSYESEEKPTNIRWSLGGNVADVSYETWGGSIDMNETYIKINNKLWFNGQPA